MLNFVIECVGIIKNTEINDMKKLLLIINPVAGKGKAKKYLFDATNIFSAHGYSVTVMPTTPDGNTEAEIIARAKDFDLAVAIGGDGTLNAVASGIVKSGTNLPMGYIPLGSTNDFGLSLGLSSNVKEACTKIATTEPKTIDVGTINGRHFVYVACTGIFTGASYSTSQKMKHIFGHAAYVLKGACDLCRPQKAHYVIETDDGDFEGDFLYAGVSNTVRLAGIFSLERSNVVFNDGIFELTMIKAPTGPLNGAALLGNIITSRIHTHRFVRKKIKKAVIRCNKEKGWSVDGENGGKVLETVIEVKEKALRFIY